MYAPHSKSVETKGSKPSERRKWHEGGVEPDEDQSEEGGAGGW